MSQIDGKGWFIWTISSLKAGVSPCDEHGYNPYTSKETLVGAGLARALSSALAGDFDTLRAIGLAKVSRKGWFYVDHPELGRVAWKSGVDFRTNRQYLFVRVDGRTVLAYWPGLDYPYAYGTPAIKFFPQFPQYKGE